jgi:hypothetical protein
LRNEDISSSKAAKTWRGTGMPADLSNIAPTQLPALQPVEEVWGVGKNE